MHDADHGAPAGRPEAAAVERRMGHPRLEALPDLQRQVLMLRERSVWELEDIATPFGLSLTHVRVRLHRARLKVFGAVAGS